MSELINKVVKHWRRVSICGMSENVIVRNSEILGGTPVFRGTRVPLRNLLDYLEDDSMVDEFLADFPTVSRGQVIAFLEQTGEKIAAAV